MTERECQQRVDGRPSQRRFFQKATRIPRNPLVLLQAHDQSGRRGAVGAFDADILRENTCLFDLGRKYRITAFILVLEYAGFRRRDIVATFIQRRAGRSLCRRLPFKAWLR